MNNPTLESVRSKIIAAIPELVPDCRAVSPLSRPIRLADVLLAIDKSGRTKTVTMELWTNNVRVILFGDRNKYFEWNLLSDNLSLASPETLNYLDQIL